MESKKEDRLIEEVRKARKEVEEEYRRVPAEERKRWWDEKTEEYFQKSGLKLERKSKTRAP